MPRKKRIWYPGATYHVMSRGNRRMAIYKDEEDYLYFLDVIKMTREIYDFWIHSICMMTNHYHMEIETADVELWRIMQKINSIYAGKFNLEHNCSGHLFEGRYTACLIEDEGYFLEVSRYIHLNPVKAKMVREPIDYKYSSYSMLVGKRESRPQGKVGRAIAEIVDTERIMSIFGEDPHEHYRKFVEGRISHEEQEMQIMKDMKENELWLPE